MKILILAPSEICYHPRLLKAGDFFDMKGCEIIVFNAITGLAQKQVYEETISRRNWKVYSNDITKQSFRSYFRWFLSSALFKTNQIFARITGIYLSFKHGLVKSFIFFPNELNNVSFDIIIVNLVDSLPFAISLARKTSAKVLYDSQEYFKGQYSILAALNYNWVVKAENSFINNSEIICTTTNVLKEKLEGEFSLSDKVFLLRNSPNLKKINYNKSHSKTLKIVWHGLTIVPENTRGLHIILKAISFCKTPVHFYIQGNITETNSIRLNKMLQEFNIIEKVTILKPALPDEIVESLVDYDLGVAGELSTEENQLLTSSNKLFEYIAAGLAVVFPNLPGIAETIKEYKNGLLFEQGNSKELSMIIDDLNNNRLILEKLQSASKKAYKTDLNWENDYSHIFDTLCPKKH